MVLSSSSSFLIINVFVGKSILMFLNWGRFKENPAVPGMSGYNPIDDKTYHAPIVPRSSFPGSPEEVVLYISLWILLIVKEVFKLIKKSNHLNRLVTLSPLTEMARKFHLKNGAIEIQVNEETQNFEYKL